MRAPLVISLGIVAAAGLAGAYALGVFDAPAPASSAEPAAVTAGDPATPAPAEGATRPATSASRPSDAVPEIRTPLPPPPTTATLTVRSDVPGADVFIDNAFVGKAPAVVDNVSPGQHKISVSAPGYETVAEFRDIVPGPADISLALKTIRLDRRVAVTHRHRLGSCEGTLIATPAGLRYETSRTEDAFSVALTGLDAFDADYVKRSLKVGVRGGRDYDFTAPEGKADDLYSFYQDVEKVRQRMTEEGER